MALQINMTETNVGLEAPQAYARIMSLNFNATDGKVSVHVDIYASEAARQAGKIPIGGAVYSGTVGIDFPSLDESIPGIRAAVYTWLKTLPAFSGAVDV